MLFLRKLCAVNEEGEAVELKIAKAASVSVQACLHRNDVPHDGYNEGHPLWYLALITPGPARGCLFFER